MGESKSFNSKRYAAIDVGSNAVRLLVKSWFGQQERSREEVVAYYRAAPFGAKVFNSGQVSEAATEDLARVMQAFKLLMDVQGVVRFRVPPVRSAQQKTGTVSSNRWPRRQASRLN